MATDLESLHADYQACFGQAERLRAALLHELDNMLRAPAIKLGVPMEARVKTWESLSEKIQRRGTPINRCSEVGDLVGLRVILLFDRDVEDVCRMISRTLKVYETEDVSTRLAESQFGYRSHHLSVGIPDAWKSVPSFNGLHDLRAEIQVRTLAQHIWAATQHVLQYKNEESVPPPLRRALYRVSALLETVDLEFERVLDERSTYVAGVDLNSAETLNVDLIREILDAALPALSKSEDEQYGDVLPDLLAFGVETAGQLQALVRRRLSEALEIDAAKVKQKRAEEGFDQNTESRVQRGVFYTHVGLLRMMMRQEFGDRWKKYITARSAADMSLRQKG